MVDNEYLNGQGVLQGRLLGWARILPGIDTRVVLGLLVDACQVLFLHGLEELAREFRLQGLVLSMTIQCRELKDGAASRRSPLS